MIAIAIVAAVAVLIFLLLASSVTFEFEYDEAIRYKVRYLFFTFVMNPESPRRIKKRKRREEKKRKKESRKKKSSSNAAKNLKKSSDNTAREIPAENTPKDKSEKADEAADKAEASGKDEKAKKKKNKPKIDLDLIKRVYGRASPHVKRIFKKIRFSSVLVDVTVGGEDAAKAAISYGVHCALVDGLVCFLDSAVDFKAEKISIRADFDLNKSQYYVRGKVKLRLSTLLHSGIWGFFAVASEIKV